MNRKQVYTNNEQKTVTMKVKLSISIFHDGDSIYVGWFDQVKGIVAQGKSNEEVKSELLKLLRIKFEVDMIQSKGSPQIISHIPAEAKTIHEEVNVLFS